MKRSLHIIATILASVLIFAFIHLSSCLPANTHPLVEKKYDSWSGVLRAWVCSQWNCAGSFVSWLNQCASSFEKNHPGVYIEFINVSPQTVSEAFTSNVRAPELLFFSPGVFSNTALLESVVPHPTAVFCDDKALPVCMGGYIRVSVNGSVPSASDTIAHLPDEAGRSFSSAAAGLSRQASEISLPDPAIDLGLPVSADTPAVSLDLFISGQLPSLIVSQYELSNLIRLQESGRGPDWRCVPSGDYMYVDQLLLGSVVFHQDAAAPVRTPLAHAFLQFLLTSECQQKLSSIGAFSTMDTSVYPSSSPYASLEGMLHTLPLEVPSFW